MAANPAGWHDDSQALLHDDVGTGSPSTHQAASHGTALPVLALGRAEAPDPWPARGHLPHCGGRMKLRALVRDPESVERFLRHQNLWTEPLGLAEARPPPYFRSVTRLRASPQVELPTASRPAGVSPGGFTPPGRGGAWPPGAGRKVSTFLPKPQ